MSGIVIHIQPPKKARRNRWFDRQMVVSMPADLAGCVVNCDIQSTAGHFVGNILEGGWHTNSPESLGPPARSGSSSSSRRGRLYSIFYDLKITQIGKFQLKIYASRNDDTGSTTVAEATSDEIEVIKEKPEKSKLGKSLYLQSPPYVLVNHTYRISQASDG